MSLHLPDEAATARLGEDIAAALCPGDLVALGGDLGSGKTTLARSIIRAMADDDGLEVPSPTFTLVQDYETRLPILHADLYRIEDPSEVAELGIDEALGRGAAIVEWPEKGADVLPPVAIAVRLSEKDGGREAQLSGQPAAMERLQRSLEIRNFLETHGAQAASRRHLTGDASARSYERIARAGQTPRLLMNAPKRPDGPPIRNGLPYSRIAHLAETVLPFMAVDQVLRGAGFAAPRIDAADPEAGLLLVEHLGTASIVDSEGRPVPTRYCHAARLLGEVHKRRWSRRIELCPRHVYELPDYDAGAFVIETELVLDWYFPFIVGRQAAPEERRAFADGWQRALDRVGDAERSLVLRDYHSPNIIWREQEEGAAKVGLLDFQDAVIGPAAYDVASLAMDARVTIDPELEAEIVGTYKEARRQDAGFDEDSFARAYAVMAAQRNTKILGIFVRLDRRDGKPAYLRHLPRIRGYLARALAHPALSEVADFFDRARLLEERP